MQLSRLFNALAAFAVAMTISSCIEENSDDKKFQISLQGYMLEEGEGANTTFTPYFFFNSNREEHKISSIDIDGLSNAPDSLLDELTSINDYCYMTTGNTKIKKITDINGKYCITAKATTGETFSDIFNIDYDAKDGLDPIVLDTLYYDGSYIKATVKEIKGAYSIGFIFGSYNKDGKPKREYYSYFKSVTAPNFYNGKIEISQPFYTTSQLQSDFCEVKVFATTYNSIYRESRVKTLVKDQKFFMEDAK